MDGDDHGVQIERCSKAYYGSCAQERSGKSCRIGIRQRHQSGYAREDAVGGIDFAKARFYDPTLGRFLSAERVSE
jgi:hypothetical protein